MARPRKERWCEWCGDTLPWHGHTRILCQPDVKPCNKEWREWKRRERLKAAGIAPRTCLGCGKPNWTKNKSYHNRECLLRHETERHARIVEEMQKYAGLPARIVAKHLKISVHTVRYRQTLAKTRPGQNISKPQSQALTQEILRLRNEEGLSYPQIMKRLDISKGKVSGRIWREREKKRRQHLAEAA